MGKYGIITFSVWKITNDMKVSMFIMPEQLMAPRLPHPFAHWPLISTGRYDEKTTKFRI